MKTKKMKTYKEKLISVQAIQFAWDMTKAVEINSTFSAGDSTLPVRQDGKGIHTSVAGQRVDLGSYIVVEPDGDVKVLSEASFNERYE